MGLFDNLGGGPPIIENADLNCEPQNEYVSEEAVAKIDQHLDPGEKVHFLATDAGGGVKIDGEKQDSMNVSTAATDRRVFAKQNKVIGSGEISIEYSNIASVEVSFGMVQKRLNLETDSKVFGIGVGQLGKDEVQQMAKFIREMARNSGQSATNNSPESADSEDPMDKLERLGELRDAGVVTEEEFQEKKRSLLDQI